MAYEDRVESVLKALGSASPASDAIADADFIQRCKRSRIEPQVCAVGIYNRRKAAAAAEPNVVEVPTTIAEPVAVIAEPVAVIAEPEPTGHHIPWRKVARDPAQHESDMALAAKHGAIKTPRDVYALVGDDLSKEDQEVFLVIPLNLRGELKSAPYEIARGQRSKVAVGVADVMAAVHDSRCEGYLVVHNHPSGKCSPSPADRELTKQIEAATKPYGSGIVFLDHCIVGARQICSIKENKLYHIRGALRKS